MNLSLIPARCHAGVARWTLAAALAAAAALVTACGGGSDSADGAAAPSAQSVSPPAAQQGAALPAQVRTVNALDDAALATLSAGTEALNQADVDSPVSEFADLDSQAAVSLAVSSEEADTGPAASGAALQGATFGRSNVSSSSAVSVALGASAGEKITVFALGDSSNVRTLHVKQTDSGIAADQTGVRVLHAAPRVPAVDIYVSAPGTALAGTPTIAALSFANFAPPPGSGSLKVPRGDYQIRLTTAGSKDVVFDSGTVAFLGGQELLVAALPSFGSGSALNLLLLPSKGRPSVIREPKSALRAVHLSPDAPGVDVLLNDKRVANGLTFRESSDFTQTLSGTRTVKVTPAGSTASAVITADVNLPPNKAVSVLALNKLTSIEPAVIVDDGKAALAGQAKLRVLHGAAGVPAVDVYLSAPDAALPADAAVKGLTFKNAAPASGEAALAVPAGNYRVRISLAGKRDVVYDSGAFRIKAREDLLVAAIPPKAGEPAQPSPVDALVVRTRGENSLLKSVALGTVTTPPVMPTTPTLTVTASLRAVHASPQAPAVDVLVDGSTTVAGITFGNLSGRAPVADGQRALRINVAGTSTTVLSSSVTVAKDTAYSVVAYDTPAALKALVLKDEVKAVPAAGARGYIRIVNLVSNVVGTATFTGSSSGAGGFGSAAPYGETSPGSKMIGFNYSTSSALGQSELSAAVGFQLEQGNFYTVYAIGSVNAAVGKPVQLIVSRDSAAP